MGGDRHACKGTPMIEHNDIMTTISFPVPDGDAETVFSAACVLLQEHYPATTARYSLAPRGAIFVWDICLGLVLHANIRWVNDHDGRVIDVFAMTMCQPHGYEQAALLFAAEIGRTLHNQYRVGGGRGTCSANAETCNKYRQLAKEPG